MARGDVEMYTHRHDPDDPRPSTAIPSLSPAVYKYTSATSHFPFTGPLPASSASMAPPRVTMEIGADGVAIITFSNPPVNALNPQLVAELKDKFAAAHGRDEVKAIVLTGRGGVFCGGFDVNVFVEIQKTGDLSILPDMSVGLVIDAIEDGKKPSVAAIEGFALGGGFEMAMGCHARVASPGAQLGLPELSFGIIPGSGGTQRLPRLAGLSKAVETMLSSKLIMSEEGNKIGVVDAVVPPGDLLKISRLWALDIAERRKPWVRSLQRVDRLGSLLESRQILKRARHTAPNMPQHKACIDVIEEGLIHGGYNGIFKESKVLMELILSETSKGLFHAFVARSAASKVPNVTDIGLKPRHFKKVAVIGGGLMGSGIATALVLSNIFVVLKEINPECLLKGLKMIEANVQGLVAKRKLSKLDADKALSFVRGVLDYSEFKDVDLVIEAVIEDVKLKQTIFCDLEKTCPSNCILATNTSTIGLHTIGEKTSSHDRIVGAHFFSPAHVMPLLEIVRTEKTSAQVIFDLMAMANIIKKVPVVVGNCSGFAVNRTFFPYAQSSHILVNLGIGVFRIDKVISSFGLPIGPFQLQDLSGYGVASAVGQIFADAFPDRTFQYPLVELLTKSGRNGKNNGKGYYIYEKHGKPKPDPSIMPIIEESRRRTKIMPCGKPISVTDQEIVEMILFPVVNEACRVLDDGIVVRASDLDVASILGMGFPSYRGGIVFWADTIGPRYIYSCLKSWSRAYPSLHNFYKPSRFLEERAIKGIPLSASGLNGSTSKSRL